MLAIKIKRAIVLGAAKTTLLEVEELKTRTNEEVEKLTNKLFDNGVRYSHAAFALKYAETCEDDELVVSEETFRAIESHIPER